MAINDKIEQLNRQIVELNARVFGLEGRMKVYEELLIQDREHRDERHKGLMDTLSELKKDMQKVQFRLAWYAGGLAVLGFIFKMASK